MLCGGVVRKSCKLKDCAGIDDAFFARTILQPEKFVEVRLEGVSYERFELVQQVLLITRASQNLLIVARTLLLPTGGVMCGVTEKNAKRNKLRRGNGKCLK